MDQTAYFEQMRQKRRAEILEEARQMILAEGPMTFTMQNLSKRLDISNVTLYKYLKNGEDLLRTLYLETSQKYGGYSGSRISEETPLEAFLQNIRFSLDEYLECREDMALLTTLSLFGRTFGEASENLFGETFCKKEIALLAEAQRQGQVRDDLPVEEVFRFLAALCSSYLRRIALMTEREYQEQKEMISWQKRELLAMIHAYLTGHLADPHP